MPAPPATAIREKGSRRGRVDAWAGSSPGAWGWVGGRGRITPALLDRLPELSAPTFYLVGNGAMISELKRELIARGVNRRAQIRTEAFFD